MLLLPRRQLAFVLVYFAVSGGTCAAAEGDPLQRLADNATYELSAFSSYFPMKIARDKTDNDSFEAWSRLMATSQMDLSDSLIFRIKMFGIFSTMDGDHHGALTQPNQTHTRARYADFARLALTYNAPDFSIVAGKSELSAGVGTLYSPADRYETSYGATPMHAFKTGVWQGRLDYPVGDDTISVAVLPYENRSTGPDNHSRWLGSGNSSSFLFNNLSLPVGTDVTETFHESAPENWGYLAKYKASRSGYDFFVLAHHGPSSYPVVFRETIISPVKIVFPIVETIAAGATVTIDRWELHGETSYQDTPHDRDQDFGKYLFGFSYRDTDLANILGWEEIQPLVEYAGEFIVSNRQDGRYLVTSAGARPYRDAVLARIEAKMSERWRWLVGGSFNFVDRDSSLAAGVEYKFNDNVSFRLDARHFSGVNDSQFGRWRRNDNGALGVQWKF